jgi:enediyne biosynthesis protein E4
MTGTRPILAAVPLFSALAFAQAETPRTAPPEPAPAPRIRFEDVARGAGIDFVHHNCPTPRKHLIETMPGGVAVFDYDGDGRPDLFFTNGAAIPQIEKDSPQYWNRLFRNEGGMKFTDRTDAAFLRGEGYSMAAAVADYDNDGDPDLFVGGVHQQHLYRNAGGRFEDVTAKVGLASGQWVVGAGWFDYDNDGWLDLLMVNYTVWTADMDRFCGDQTRGIRVYCHPKYFEPIPLSLFRNRGDGTFEDVSARSGIAAHKGRGMGVAFADYDRDGFLDFYVTNDKLPSFLFRNRGDGTFEETALLAGASLPEHGQDISAMAVDFRDYDNDGLPDILVTALAGETFPLYRNLGKGLFQDVTYRALLSPLVAARSGWSNAFVDLDNDGWKDLFTANAHVNDAIDRFESNSYRLSNSVFRNRGDGTFADASAESGLAAGPRRAHRGAGFADLDDDGRLDVVVTALEAPTELWWNRAEPTGHSLGLRLVGTKSNRDGIGALVTLSAGADPRWSRQYDHMTTAVGYASSTLAPLHFGTGTAKVVDRVEIRWPSGTVQVLQNVATDQVLTVRESQ